MTISRACIQNLPDPTDPWREIFGFIDQFAEEIDGYGFGDGQGGYESFLEKAERDFSETGNVIADLHAALALVYLVYRRHRWSEPDTNIEEYRPFVAALLRQAKSLSVL